MPNTTGQPQALAAHLDHDLTGELTHLVIEGDGYLGLVAIEPTSRERLWVPNVPMDQGLPATLRALADAVENTSWMREAYGPHD
jgi:hypothetical protein